MKTYIEKIDGDTDPSIKRKQKALAIAIGFFTVFVMCTDGLFPLPKNGHIDIWSMCNWGLTYETGFIIRGLVGTVVTAIVGAVSFKQVYIISLFLFFILVVQFVFINISIYMKSKRFAAFVLIFFFLAQPSNARWLMNGSMFTRLDNFVIIFALICFFVVYKCNDTLLYSLLLPLSVLSILIHEIFAVAFTSLLFAMILIKTYLRLGKFSIKPLLFYYLPILIIFVVIIQTGSTELSCKEFTARMQQNLAPDLREGMVAVARDVVVDNMAKKVERVQYLFSKDSRNLMILTYVAISPTLILIAGMFRKIYKSAQKRAEKISIVLIAGSCFAPLTSSFFGYDQYRWIGYFIFCLSAAIVFLYFIDEKYRDTIMQYIEDNIYYFIIASVIAMTFGTFRDMQTTPFLEKIYYNRLLVLPDFFK